MDECHEANTTINRRATSIRASVRCVDRASSPIATVRGRARRSAIENCPMCGERALSTEHFQSSERAKMLRAISGTLKSPSVVSETWHLVSFANTVSRWSSIRRSLRHKAVDAPFAVRRQFRMESNPLRACTLITTMQQIGTEACYATGAIRVSATSRMTLTCFRRRPTTFGVTVRRSLRQTETEEAKR